MAKETDFNLWDSIFHTRKEQKTQPEEQKSVPKIVQPEKPEWLKQPPQPPKPREDVILEQARTKMTRNLRGEYETAIKLLQTIPGWKDADQLLQSCKKALEEREKLEAAARRKQRMVNKKQRRKMALVLAVFLLVEMVLVGLWINSCVYGNDYGRAVRLAKQGKCEQAVQMLESLEQKYGRNEDVKECIYKVASAFEDAGEYKWAYRLFSDLSIYKDSLVRKKAVHTAFEKTAASQTKAGDVLYCGEYMQQTSQNKEPLPWIVLEVKDGKALLITQNIIDSFCFENRDMPANWSDSTVRNWLNTIVCGGIVGQDLEEYVLSRRVDPDPNPYYDTDNGLLKMDKLFLLSAEEAARYFPTEEQRKCTATPFAQDRGAETNSWMLRTMGKDGDHVTYVDAAGRISYEGQPVGEVEGGIRPAMWVDLIGLP